MNAQCNIPTNIRGDNQSCNGYIARWEGSATSFYLDVATTNTFDSGTILSAYNNKNVGNVNNVTLTELNPSTTYFFRVRASGSSCVSSNSSTGTFTTLSIQTPTNIRGDNISCGGYIARWDGSATKFFLDVATTSTFDAGTILPAYNNKDVGTANNITLAGLTLNTNYYFRVRRLEACGLSGNSNVGNFKTLAIVQPTASAATNLSCNAAQMNWNAVSNSSGYYFDIAKDANFLNILPNYNNFYISYAGYHVSNLPGGTLYFRVRSTDNCGNITSYSNVINFATTGPIAGDVSPTQNICSGTKPTIDLTLTGNSSPVQNWQSASDVNFTSNVQYIGVTTSILPSTTVGNLTQSTYFRAVILQTGTNYCTGYSTPVLITVGNSISAASASPMVCANTTMTAITHATSGFTTIVASNGLPAGVNASLNNNILTISGTPTSSGNYNYSIQLNGSCGNANATGTIRVNSAPAITTQPTTPATTCSGSGTQTMTVVASGTGLTYQWRKNGSNLANGTVVSGATTATLTLTSPTTSEVGSYDVVITGTCSPAVTSTANNVTIYTPTITNAPQAKTCANRHITYSTQTGKSNYIWSVSGALNTDYKIIDRGTATDNYIVLEWLTTGSKTVRVNYANPPGCSASAPATYTTEIVILDKGQVNGGRHICPGDTLPTLTFNTYANSSVRYPDTSVILKWQYSDGNNTNYIDIPGTTGQTTYTPTSISGTTRQYRVVVDNGACTDQSIYSAIDIDVTTAITAQSTAGQSACNGSAFTPLSITAVGTPRGGQSSVEYQWYRNTTNSNTGGTSLGAANNARTNTYTPQHGTAGTSYYYYCIVTGNCSTATSAVSGAFITTAPPIAPTIVSKQQPTCTTPTGSITLSGLPATGILRSLVGNSTTVTFTITGTTTTISGLTPGKYKFAVDNPCGTPLYSTEVNLSGNTWNGASWSGGNAGPVSNDILIFEGDYTATNDITACSCTITNNAKVTVSTGKTMTLSDFVHVDSGSLTFENNASLLQTNPNAVNSGSINYMRSTPEPGIRQADYVYWSSPVKDQTLVGVSQDLTLGDKYYMYGGTGVSWIGVPKTTKMVIGKGYIIRGPQNWLNTAKRVYTATFTGTPNNGSYKTAENFQAGKSYLLGNPYPSALDADELIKNNPILKGTLYFWTHNTPVVLVGAYKYNADDYASYNFTGGVGTEPDTRTGTPAGTGNNTNNKSTPSGKIGAGQSFMAPFKDAGEITFTNDMRVGGPEHNQFFKPGKASKTTAIEKHRVWLNMTNTEGAFKQLLVGYIEGATNDFEGRYDGLSLDGNKYVDFYSISNATKYTIQGRALPFTDADIVPLGYKSSIAGDFTISINQADGVLSTQVIYLEDKASGKIHDLTTSNYAFTTEIGTFEDRFILRYTNKTLGTGDFENIENGLLVAVNDKTIKVIAAKENIKEVAVYDISGRQLYNKNKIGATELQISNLQSANQVLLVKVVLENDYVATKKIIFN